MVYVLLADGFEEIEALSVTDILRRADIDVQLISVDDESIVKGSHDIRVCSDGDISSIKDIADAIILPGGLPGTINLQNNSAVLALLDKHFKKGKYICAICAAPSILGKMLFLDNKKATCYPSYEKYLTNAIVCDDNVVVADNVITSRAAGTSLDFGYKLVELLKDSATANEIRSSMLYD